MTHWVNTKKYIKQLKQYSNHTSFTHAEESRDICKQMQYSSQDKVIKTQVL